MKKFLLFLVCLLLFFVSCKKKEAVVPVNTISATVDGATLNFNTNVNGRYDTPPGGPTTLVIIGETSSDPTGAIIGISLTSHAALTKGTYVVSSTNNQPTVWPSVVYNRGDPTANISPQPFSTDNYGNYPTTITVTSISSTNIQGTFSGTLVHPTINTDTKTLTNGKFNVNISY